jgi:hypothetical protein
MTWGIFTGADNAPHYYLCRVLDEKTYTERTGPVNVMFNDDTSKPYSVNRIRSLFDSDLKLSPRYTLTKGGKLRVYDLAPAIESAVATEEVDLQLALLVRSGRLTEAQLAKARLFSFYHVACF